MSICSRKRNLWFINPIRPKIVHRFSFIYGNELKEWLKEWKRASSHTIARMMELYEQLTPTNLYTSHKTRTTQIDDVTCRLCGKAAVGLPHVLAACSALAQNLSRHNAAHKTLFFEMLKVMKLANTFPPWYSPKVPEPHYESVEAQAFWDVPVYSEYNDMKANRAEDRFVDRKSKKVMAVEMNCPWINNREKKDEEKTLNYDSLRWELKQQFLGCRVEQYNVMSWEDGPEIWIPPCERCWELVQETYY